MDAVTLFSGPPVLLFLIDSIFVFSVFASVIVVLRMVGGHFIVIETELHASFIGTMLLCIIRA